MKRKASFTTKKSTDTKRPKYKRQDATVGMTTVQAGLTELKFNDATFNTDATTTPTIVDLNNFAAGDTVLLRDGNKIAMRSLELRVRFALEAITTNALMRFVVVVDNNANQTAPTWTGVFDSATVDSQRLIGNMGRYTILMDKVIPLNQASSAGGPQKGFFKKYIKIRDPEQQLVQYTAGTALVPMKNSLTLMYISDLSSGVADVDIQGTARLRYVG